MSILKDLKLYLEKYSNKNPKKIQQYGTAGFRTKAEDLFHITFRTGILASLRSKFLKNRIIGVMITASHNPEEDNGLKIIEPDGSMLEQSWELLATKLANVPDEQLEKTVLEILDQFHIKMEDPGHVYLAMDTRKSSPQLSEALICGIKASGCQYTNFGLLTTPQLHYIVRCINSGNKYGQPTENGYYEKLSQAFLKLTQDSNKKLEVVIDCANGVGALKMKLLAPYVQDKISFKLINTGDGILNYKCGADFVKVNQTAPESIQLEENKRYASFDGDADRIVYYYKNSEGKFQLLDGDKIAVLVARFLNEQLEKSGLLNQIEMTVVQTAYANGNSTKYIKDVLNLKCDCVPTGVKHLHHRALQSQIGIYFEANGHGTILFSNQTQQKISECQNENAKKLLNFIDLVNQTVGDAISDLLIVEAILANLDITIDRWNKFYQDLPNKLLKVQVKDRTVIETTDAERKCLKPKGLQEEIDKTVAEFGTQARSFIRPSGTEDVVRIYAEAETKQLADDLAKKVANLVYDFAQGIGSKY